MSCRGEGGAFGHNFINVRTYNKFERTWLIILLVLIIMRVCFIHTTRLDIVNCDTEVLQRTRVIGRSNGGCQGQNGHSRKERNSFHYILGGYLYLKWYTILGWVRDDKHSNIEMSIYRGESERSGVCFCKNLVIVQPLVTFFYLIRWTKFL